MNLLKRSLSSLLVLSSVLMVSGCSLFSGEKDNITISPSPVVTNQFTMSQVWKNSTSGNKQIYSLLGPTSYGDVVYIAGRSGDIKAIDANKGSPLWKTDVSTSSFFRRQSALLSGGVSADEQHVYIGSERAQMFALDRTNGKVVWQKEMAGEVLAKPLSSDGLLLVNTSNGFLQALKTDTGEEVWRVNLEVPPLSLRLQATPVVANGAVIVGDSNGRVNALLIDNGLLIWQQRISQPSGSTEIARLSDVDATPVVDNGIIYTIGYNGALTALELHSGQTLWKRNVGSTHNLVVQDKHIYLVDQHDVIQSFTTDGGSMVWKQPDLTNRRLTDPVWYQGYIAVGDFEGYLYLLDPKTGDFAYKINVSSSGLLASPIVVDNKLIVQARNGDVYAFER
ncbi:outer membrane protein assembly factor BamB [Utexia brackfieldae]|uniref:outer membrane protein assembly factor BamB n=1 Tax=Utexia brackfieldae TaxID=3074108 RepID=UPI00370D2517